MCLAIVILYRGTPELRYQGGTKVISKVFYRNIILFLRSCMAFFDIARVAEYHWVGMVIRCDH